jgi:hypothetical protein
MTTGAGRKNAEERWRLLVKALRSRPDDAACLACLDRLDEYMAAQLAGQDYTAHFPDVAVHLDACPDCAGAYARLYELELAEAAGRLPQSERLPAPDLCFLSREAAGPFSLAQRLRAALRRTGDRLMLQLSAELLPLLRPLPAAMAVRAPAEAERYGEVLLVLEPDETLRPDLPVNLTAYRDAQRPEECLVEVVVEPPGQSWPDLEGIPVALIVSGERREVISDAWGLAAFPGVPIARLPDMAVEITL